MDGKAPFGPLPDNSDRPRYGIRRNITWLAAANLAVKPIWLAFVLVFCWRYMGTSGYGVFSAALWLTHIPISLTDIGLATFTTREVARSRSSASVYFSNILAFKVALAPLAWIVGILAAKLLGYGRVEMLSVAWAGVYAIGLSITIYVRSYFQAFEDLRLEGLSVVFEKVLVVLAGAIALVVFRSPHETLAAMAAAMVCTAGLNVLWVSRNLAPFKPGLIAWKFVRSSLTSALPLGLSWFFAVVYLRAGGVLLEHWHGEVVAGLFAGPFRILEALFLIIVVFTAAVLPRLSHLFHAGNLGAFKSVFVRSAGTAVALAFVCSLGIWVVGDFIIQTINPDPTATEAGRVLRMLIWLLPIFTARELLVSALIAADQQVYLARTLAVCLAVSLGLNGLLTLPLGSTGVIMVYVITDALILSICGYRYVRIFHGSPQLLGDQDLN